MNEANSNSPSTRGGTTEPAGAVHGAKEKRRWHRPIITTLDALVRTESGVNPYRILENAYYRPQS